MGAFNLDDQLVFYGSYHNNVVNQIIHGIFVPQILWTSFVAAAYSGTLLPIPSSLSHFLFPSSLVSKSFLLSYIQSHFVINAAFFILVLYTVYYFLVAPRFVSLTCNTFIFFLFLTATHFQSSYPLIAWKVALVLHFIGWYMQIHPGHLIFENRKPALSDSFFQSLVLSPLFMWFELMFALGFYKDLKKKIQPKIEANIAEFRKSKKLE